MRFLGFLASSSLLFGCLPTTIAPPPPPPKQEPVIEDPPTTRVADGHGRVVLDAEGENAKVSRVTETTTGSPPVMMFSKSYVPPMRKEELLCVTPCIVDLRQGAHTLVFASRNDPGRASTADIVVSAPKTSIVRHTIGKEGRMNAGYFGGAALTLAGTGLTLMGSLMTGIAASAGPPEPGKGDVRDALPVGLVLLGAGILSLTGGILLMTGNRPETQPGSTLQWTK